MKAEGALQKIANNTEVEAVKGNGQAKDMTENVKDSINLPQEVFQGERHLQIEGKAKKVC